MDWAALEASATESGLVRSMNRVASAWKALGEQDHVPWGFQWLDADDAEHSMYSFLRWSADGTEVVACVANLTPVPRRLPHRPALGRRWQVLLDTNATYFGGTGSGGPRRVGR